MRLWMTHVPVNCLNNALRALRALPVSPCLYEGRRGCPYPAMGSGRQGPQLPRQLAYLGPILKAVVRSQGLGAAAPQPLGALGQLGKEQALPCPISFLTVELDLVPSSAELHEFLKRQECGSTETVSEASWAYGICSCSHGAQIASYETTSALATLPSPEISKHHSGVSPLLQPLPFYGPGCP